MSFWYQNNLKIEFRAIPYSTTHALEYRISPDQDLEFEVEKSFLGFKYKKKNKYKTNWHQVEHFVNYLGACRYDESECYLPIFVHNKKEFEEFKNNYKTIGEFFAWLDKENERERKEWEIERAIYLSTNNNWY